MARGFIYVVTTVTRDYVQERFSQVPTKWEGRLYFGPCKKPMRPKMLPGDWVFGLSHSKVPPRRIVFVAELEERITFAEAYDRFPDLRGPEGPIHVRPVDGTGRFPECSYQHIPGASHANDWKADLASQRLDAFFVCSNRAGWRGRWLGKYGPEIDDEILRFLKKCSVHGQASLLSAQNSDATVERPIRHGGLYTGLHLETDHAESLLALCASRIPGMTLLDSVVTPPRRSRAGGDCGVLERARESGPNKPIRVTKHKC